MSSAPHSRQAAAAPALGDIRKATNAAGCIALEASALAAYLLNAAPNRGACAISEARRGRKRHDVGAIVFRLADFANNPAFRSTQGVRMADAEAFAAIVTPHAAPERLAALRRFLDNGGRGGRRRRGSDSPLVSPVASAAVSVVASPVPTARQEAAAPGDVGAGSSGDVGGQDEGVPGAVGHDEMDWTASGQPSDEGRRVEYKKLNSADNPLDFTMEEIAGVPFKLRHNAELGIWDVTSAYCEIAGCDRVAANEKLRQFHCKNKVMRKDVLTHKALFQGIFGWQWVVNTAQFINFLIYISFQPSCERFAGPVVDYVMKAAVRIHAGDQTLHEEIDAHAANIELFPASVMAVINNETAAQARDVIATPASRRVTYEKLNTPEDLLEYTMEDIPGVPFRLPFNETRGLWDLTSTMSSIAGHGIAAANGKLRDYNRMNRVIRDTVLTHMALFRGIGDWRWVVNTPQLIRFLIYLSFQPVYHQFAGPIAAHIRRQFARYYVGDPTLHPEVDDNAARNDAFRRHIRESLAHNEFDRASDPAAVRAAVDAAATAAVSARLSPEMIEVAVRSAVADRMDAIPNFEQMLQVAIADLVKSSDSLRAAIDKTAESMCAVAEQKTKIAEQNTKANQEKIESEKRKRDELDALEISEKRATIAAEKRKRDELDALEITEKRAKVTKAVEALPLTSRFLVAEDVIARKHPFTNSAGRIRAVKAAAKWFAKTHPKHVGDTEVHPCNGYQTADHFPRVIDGKDISRGFHAAIARALGKAGAVPQVAGQTFITCYGTVNMHNNNAPPPADASAGGDDDGAELEQQAQPPRGSTTMV